MKTCTPLASRGRVVALTASLGFACGGKPTESKPAAEGAEAPSATSRQELASAGVGQAAPDFEVRDEGGNLVRLADHRGKRPVLLAFYPKDFTSG